MSCTRRSGCPSLAEKRLGGGGGNLRARHTNASLELGHEISVLGTGALPQVGTLPNPRLCTHQC